MTVDLVAQVQQLDIYSFVANGFCFIFEEIDFCPNAVCMSNFEAIERYATKYPDETLKFFKSGWQQNIDFALKNVYELPFACEHDLGKHKEPFVKDGFFSLDPGEKNYCGDTVLLDFAIPLAFYMGFEQIYLMGVDCDYSKGYFTGKYDISAKEEFKGMVNNDYSIAIPSYQYVKNFLNSHGREIYKITESKRLNFIKTCSLDKFKEKELS